MCGQALYRYQLASVSQAPMNDNGAPPAVLPRSRLREGQPMLAASDILATCTRRPSHLQATSTRGLENRQGRGCLRAETRGRTPTCCLAAPGCLRGSSIQMASHFWVLSQAGAMEPAGLGRPGGRAPHLCNSTRPRPRGEGPTCTRRRAAQSPAPGGPHHSNVPGRCLPREDRSDARQSRILV